MYFVRREKRFLAYMKYMDQEVLVYCCNPGKMSDILVPGAECIVTRKTSGILYEWQAIKIEDQWIGINTSNPNRLASLLIPVLFASTFTAEKSFGQYRADFASSTTIVEIKNVHWKPNIQSVRTTFKDTAYFPDCITTRGARQLLDLQALSATYQCYVIYIVQRSDVDSITIADFIDEKYYKNYLSCSNIKTLGFNCLIQEDGMKIHNQIHFFNQNVLPL